jgi:hypothetical protein
MRPVVPLPAGVASWEKGTGARSAMSFGRSPARRVRVASPIPPDTTGLPTSKVLVVASVGRSDATPDIEGGCGDEH